MYCPASDLLSAAFAGTPPSQITELVDLNTCRPLLTEFKMGIVLPCGSPAPVRVAWSAQNELDRFHNVVTHRHSLDPSLTTFLSSAITSCRRVLDTDGETDQVFLDDLQDHSETDQDGHERICRTWEARAETAPLVNPTTRNELTSMGGIWTGRRREGHMVSTLWTSEIKWTKSAAFTSSWVSHSSPPRGWTKTQTALAKHDLSVYPDGIESHQDERIDLTVGIA